MDPIPAVNVSPCVPAIIAHRGASHDAPENTLAAARLAWAQAADATEACWVVEQTVPPGGVDVAHVVGVAQAARIDGLDLQHDWPVDAPLVRRARDAGLKMYVWTVDEVGDARRMIRAGVDGITTNRPGWLREQIGPAKR